MSRKIGAGMPARGPVVPSIPGSPDEALALAVRISRFSRDPDALMFDEAFSELAAREGGRLRDPRAAPGELTFGDLSFAASRLSPDEARELYRQAYWTPALCDHLPRAVALEVFDMAVSSGVDAALRALKAALRLAGQDLPDEELVKEVRDADPVRLRARFLVARLSDIAGRMHDP